MRHARLALGALFVVVAVAACSSTEAGWTYAPAPSVTPAPSGSAEASASAAPSGPANSLAVTASGIAFQPAQLSIAADTAFQIVFDNQDASVPHDIDIHHGDANGPVVFDGAVFAGVATQTYDVPALEAGAYGFKCSVHPTMTGTLTAE